LTYRRRNHRSHATVDGHNRSRSVPVLDPHSDAKGDPRQNPAGIRARVIAAAEALRAAASDDGQEAPLGALNLKSDPGPPMTLGSAAGTVAQSLRSSAEGGADGLRQLAREYRARHRLGMSSGGWRRLRPSAELLIDASEPCAVRDP
jgi:hypothetical protein